MSTSNTNRVTGQLATPKTFISNKGKQGLAIELFQEFLKVVTNLEKSYNLLQKKVAYLTRELRKKNQELKTQVDKTHQLSAYLDNLLQSMEAGVIGVDGEGRVYAFNKAAEAITGMSKQQVLGTLYLETVYPNLPFENHPVQALEWEQEFSPVEVEFCRPGTDKAGARIIRRTIKLIHDRNNQVVGAMEILEDITDYRRMQEELRIASNMSALREMAKQVAHKIRNPLGGIVGFASLLERDIDEDDPKYRYVQKINEGAARLEYYISDLLMLTQPLHPNFCDVDLLAMVKSALAHAREKPIFKLEQIEYEFRSDGKSIKARTDPDLFNELIVHLLESASVNGTGSMRIIVEFDEHACNGKAKFSLKFDGSHATSHDIEKGIHPENIFTKESGLSMAIVRRIMEVLNGSFQIRYLNRMLQFDLAFPTT